MLRLNICCASSSAAKEERCSHISQVGQRETKVVCRISRSRSGRRELARFAPPPYLERRSCANRIKVPHRTDTLFYGLFGVTPSRGTPEAPPQFLIYLSPALIEWKRYRRAALFSIQKDTAPGCCHLSVWLIHHVSPDLIVTFLETLPHVTLTCISVRSSRRHYYYYPNWALRARNPSLPLHQKHTGFLGPSLNFGNRSFSRSCCLRALLPPPLHFLIRSFEPFARRKTCHFHRSHLLPSVQIGLYAKRGVHNCCRRFVLQMSTYAPQTQSKIREDVRREQTARFDYNGVLGRVRVLREKETSVRIWFAACLCSSLHIPMDKGSHWLPHGFMPDP